MRPRSIGLTVTLALAIFLAPLAAEAQQAGKIYRIGLLLALSPELVQAVLDAFRQGLRDLGYVEGKNIVIEYRSAEGKLDRLPGLAAELVRLKVDVIVTGLNPGTVAAKQATTTIPIVMAIGINPVGAGLVPSLARPGGNVTGLTYDVSPEIHAKRLQLLKEVVPQVSRVAVLWDPSFAPDVVEISARAVRNAAQKLGVTLHFVEVRGPDDFDQAFAAMARERANGLLAFGGPLLFAHRRRIADLAAKHRLPATYVVREFADSGGLFSFGANQADLYRRAATYVDKILKGAKPADLPVEQPTKFELVINLKTAKALGLTIPQSVLIRADEIIQ